MWVSKITKENLTDDIIDGLMEQVLTVLLFWAA